VRSEERADAGGATHPDYHGPVIVTLARSHGSKTSHRVRVGYRIVDAGLMPV